MCERCAGISCHGIFSTLRRFSAPPRPERDTGKAAAFTLGSRPGLGDGQTLFVENKTFVMSVVFKHQREQRGEAIPVDGAL